MCCCCCCCCCCRCGAAKRSNAATDSVRLGSGTARGWLQGRRDFEVPIYAAACGGGELASAGFASNCDMNGDGFAAAAAAAAMAAATACLFSADTLRTGCGAAIAGGSGGGSGGSCEEDSTVRGRLTLEAGVLEAALSARGRFGSRECASSSPGSPDRLPASAPYQRSE